MLIQLRLETSRHWLKEQIGYLTEKIYALPIISKPWKVYSHLKVECSTCNAEYKNALKIELSTN